MKISVRKASLRLALQWAQRTLFAGAFLMLANCGFVVVDTWWFQRQEIPKVERLAGQSSPPPAAVGPGGLIGRIEIQRLGVSVAVAEGTTEHTLRHAAGHIKGTALPGQAGNVGIAGHRDTLFRPLRNIHRDDIITLTTLLGEFRYRVVSTKVVNPRDVEVLNPDDGNQILTLVTCYPFYFVGPAPDRFIVRAARVL
jgi:sortase A